MNLETLTTDLQALTTDELEKVQLAVNGEVALRIQNERLAKRIEVAVTDAQGVGFNDDEITTIIEEARVKARKGNIPDDKPKTPTRSRTTEKTEK